MVEHFDAGRFRQLMEPGDFIERRFVERAPDRPAFVAMTKKVFLAQVFDPDQTLSRIVKINLRRAKAVGFEKLRDLDVMPVLFALEIIFYQDERLVRRRADAIKLPVRSAFLDRGDIDVIDIELRNARSRLAKQEIGLHD